MGVTVMLSVAGSDAHEGACDIILPPMVVADWAHEKIRHWSHEPIQPELFFFAELHDKVRVLGDIPSKRLFESTTGIRFCAIDERYQPHFFLDSRFRLLHSRTEPRVQISVRISSTTDDGPFTRDYISDSGNFNYVGEGDLRLLLEDGTIIGEWSETQPHLEELESMERRWLHSR
jgi:hypothetical protein